MTIATPGSSAAEQVGRVLEIARGVFGPSLLGAYLHGSAVLGGLRPTSDVDVLVVINRQTKDEERHELVRRLMAISDPSRAHRKRPVELTVVRDADVRPWRYPPRMEFQYGEWLRADFERGIVREPAPNADLAPLIAMVLMGNHALIGPPPGELLVPVPLADVRRAIITGVPALLDELEPDTRNVLLTLARIWHTLAMGEITSKDASASWAAERLSRPARETLLSARTQYLEGTHGDWSASLPEARAAAEALSAAIRAETSVT